MQGLKQCKIAQGSEIANEQQRGAVWGAVGGLRHLKPYFWFQRHLHIIYCSILETHVIALNCMSGLIY